MNAQVPVPDHEMAQIYARVFSTPEGRKVLDHITDRLCLLNTPIVASDALSMAAHVAARNLGLRIKHMANGSLVLASINVTTSKETNRE